MANFTKPHFTRNEDEKKFQKLRQEVYQVVHQLKPNRQYHLAVKAIVFPFTYFLVYALSLYFGSSPAVLYACYSLMGVLIVINFLNIIHEAVHQTLFKQKWLNKLYINLFDLMGANSYIWRIRHVRLHHNYPNISGWDSDFEQSPLVRIFPHGAYLKVHKYQHIYLPLLYPLFVMNWLLIRDFRDFFEKDRMVRKVAAIPKAEYVKLFLFKGLFIFYIIVLPIIVLDLLLVNVFIAFLIMMFSASLIALIVLLSPHANTESYFPLPDRTGKIASNWMTHQITVTNDIAEDNWFTRHLMGCFNYHVAHHLFPKISHVYYPEITMLIHDFAKTNHLPYRKFPLLTSLKNHFNLLKQNAQVENVFEETM